MARKTPHHQSSEFLLKIRIYISCNHFNLNYITMVPRIEGLEVTFSRLADVVCDIKQLPSLNCFVVKHPETPHSKEAGCGVFC